MSDSSRWVVAPRGGIDLTAIEPAATDGAPGDRDATEATFAATGERLAELQTRLWAEDERSLLIVLQAMDAGGKDGTIKHVVGNFDPMGVTVHGFKQPSDVELAHDFLWRIHQRAPETGQVVVFNRSHYEDVLVVRVEKLVPEPVWRARYDHINAFEDLLADRGTTIVKLFLHISKEEQAERFRSRLRDPAKQWKFRSGDLDVRAKWDEYMAAYTEAIDRTTTERSPWYVVPADKKWYRNWAVGRILVDTLEEMDPQFPPPADDLTHLTIT